MIRASITAVMDEKHMANIELDGDVISLMALISSMIKEIAEDRDIPVEALTSGIAYTLGQEDTEGMEQ